MEVPNDKIVWNDFGQRELARTRAVQGWKGALPPSPPNRKGAIPAPSPCQQCRQATAPGILWLVLVKGLP
jgi:hypothetical protein